jgi:coenzyme F420 hydrogenase subunit beta
MNQEAWNMEEIGFEDGLSREVIRKGLCTACGACIGVCSSQAIRMNGVIPELAGECAGCGRCLQVCPGRDIHLDEMEQALFGRSRHAHERELGIHQAVYAANAGAPDIRRAATSGGVLTALLCHALDMDWIDGAILTGMDPASPALAAPAVALGKEEVQSSQKSKYMLVPGGLLSVLHQAVRENGRTRLAVVGSPCHIHAVRKLQQSPDKGLRKAFGDKIKLALGHFCAFNFFPEGTRVLIQACGADPDQVEAVQWRDTEEVPFPGDFSVTLADGEKRHIDLMREYLILGGIYTHPRCRICYDWANEAADISCGDEVDEKGAHKAGAKRSHVVVRTPAGRELFDSAAGEGKIEAEPASAQIVARNLGFLIKKVGNVPIIEERRRLALPLPEFGNYPM